MRSNRWNSMCIFLVGMLVGGGSIYVVEYSPNSLTVITSINKPDTTSPQRSTTSARTQRMNEQYQRQLAYLRILRQQQPTSANAKKPAKSPQRPTVDSLVISPPSNGPPQTRTSHRTYESASGARLYYEVLRAIPEFNSKKVYAEVLAPNLSRDMSRKELKRILKAIAEHEGFDSMTVYRTRLAREVHYSMELADTHPQALAEGLLGEYERGRFRPYKPK